MKTETIFKAAVISLILLNSLASSEKDLDTRALGETASIITEVLYDLANVIMCIMYEVVVGVAGSIAVLIYVINAVKWITSRHDPGKRAEAKENMTKAILGLLIIAVAKTAVEALLLSGGGTLGCSDGQTMNKLKIVGQGNIRVVPE